MGYEYNLDDQPTSITYPNGHAVAQTYDEDGRLHSVGDWLGNTTSFAYNPDSEQTATIFPSGTGEEDAYAYNHDGEMTEVLFMKGSETLASLAYTRYEDGQLAGTTATGLPGEAESYSYDQDSRLSDAASTGYEYDAADNPTRIGSGSLSYDNASELTSGLGASYTYDEDGQRTKTTPTGGPATSYAYDQAGDLISVSRPEEGETPKIEDSYTYDGNDLRTSETINATTKQLTWNEAEEVPLLLNNSTDSYIYGPNGLPVEQINSEEHALFLHHDQQGSTRLLTSTSGVIQASYTYNAYGQQTSHTGTATTQLGYDAQYTSPDTGLIYLRARTYDPATAQFLSIDPLAHMTGEPYSYAADDPLSNIDPTGEGLWSFVKSLLPVGAAAGADLVCGATVEVPGVDAVTCGAAADADAEAAADIAGDTATDTAAEDDVAADDDAGTSDSCTATDEILATPEVENSTLQNIVNDLYKGTTNENRIGTGTTADAVRAEGETGLPTGGTFHTMKAEQYSTALTRLLQSGQLNAHDGIVGQSLLNDLQDALGGTP